MSNFSFITVRLGKDSIPDIERICMSGIGILEKTYTINVKCTQIPENYNPKDYAFIWLGSDNNKGMPTKWKQGFKAVGRVMSIMRGASYNETSETTIDIVYIFKDAINRLDFLRSAPIEYYWCSGMPLIGIDDHANQTIRSVSGSFLCDIPALFCSINRICPYFKNDILKIEPDFERLFSFPIPKPKDFPNAKSISEIEQRIVLNETTTTGDGCLPYLTALRTKPFMLLAGISGTGKSRIVREMAFKTCPKYLQDKDGTTPGNYCMIEVKPNWHDSTELIGYYSNLSQSYQFKKFVKFLVKAQMNPEVPFFVCLDEMNLAPVEQYFAEILSILETRKHPKKDGVADMEIIKTEVIVENRYFTPSWKDKDNAVHEKIMSDADWYKEFFDIEKGSAEEIQVQKYQDADTLRTKGLKLPDNVFIIGTVNMDDTTHPFSRKVIDRAMTIEMNGGRLSDMFGGSRDLEYIEDEKIQKEWQQAFHQHYVTADEVLEEHPEYAETLKENLPAKLDAINKALKGTPFEVSYRVLNELTIMVGVMLDDKKGREDIDIDGIINHAVDNILLMKILPRIEGDADMFSISDMYKKENYITYDNRLEWLKDIAPDIKAVTTSEDDKSDSTKEDQPTAKKKLKEMNDRLSSQDFTRFWP